MKFEEAMAELEKLVREMERADAPLEEVLANYNRGAKLLASCRKELGEFERKIELLVKDDGKSGEWREMNDPAAADTVPEHSPRRSTDVELRSAAPEPPHTSEDGELPF